MPHRRKTKRSAAPAAPTGPKVGTMGPVGPAGPKVATELSVANTPMRTTMKMPSLTTETKYDAILSTMSTLSGKKPSASTPVATDSTKKPDRAELVARLRKKTDFHKWRRTGMKTDDLKLDMGESAKPTSAASKVLSNPNLIRNHMFQYGTDALAKFLASRADTDSDDTRDTMFIVECKSAASDEILQRITDSPSPRLQLLIVRKSRVYYMVPSSNKDGIAAAIRAKEVDPVCTCDNVLECPKDAKWPLPSESFRLVAAFEDAPVIEL